MDTLDTKQSILISLAILLLSAMVLFMVFGDRGLADLRNLKQERDAVLEENQAMDRQNLGMYREINRLERDLTYIEKVAREDLGMIAKDEVIIKTTRQREDER